MTTRISYLFAGATLAFSAFAAVSLAEEDAREPVDERCDYSRGFPSIPLGEHFKLRNNKWAARDAGGCIHTYSDGTFSWDWDRPNYPEPNYQPNYPSVMWGELHGFPDSATTELLPIRVGDIDTLTGRMSARTHIDEVGFKHNSNVEIWTAQTSELIKDTQTHEIMVMFDKVVRRPEEPIEIGAVSSGGRSFDYYTRIDEQLSTKHTFHIFHQSGQRDWPEGDFDVRPFFDYLIEKTADHEKPFTNDHWLANIMIGNEIWDGARGRTDVDYISWSLNGVTQTTGSASTDDPAEPATSAP